MTNFRLLGSIIIKKKYPKVVDPLKSIIISAYNQREKKKKKTLILEIFWKIFKNLHDSQEAHIYIYNEIEKRENNHFTFHFSGINILASKNFKR